MRFGGKRLSLSKKRFGRMAENSVVFRGAFNLKNHADDNFVDNFHNFLHELELEQFKIEQTAIYDGPFSVEIKIGLRSEDKNRGAQQYAFKFFRSSEHVRQPFQFEAKCWQRMGHNKATEFISVWQSAILDHSRYFNITCWL